MASLMELLERELPELPVVKTDSAEGSSAIEPDSLEAELAYTAQRAKEVFGYDVLHNEIQAAQKKREEARHALAEKTAHERKQAELRIKVREIFTSLDHYPYSQTSVEAYKQAMLDRAEGVRFVRNFEPAFNAILLTWFLLSFVEIPLCWMKLTGWEWLWSLNGWVAVLPLAFCSIMLFKHRMPLKREVNDGPGYHWERRELRWFSKKVEPFALDKALQIHELLPEAEFWVDALCEKPAPKVETRPVAWSAYDDDPFLVMSIAGEDHYIEVWGESDYEKAQHP